MALSHLRVRFESFVWYNGVLDHKLPLKFEFLRLSRQLSWYMILASFCIVTIRDHPYTKETMVPGFAHLEVAKQKFARTISHIATVSI